MMMESGLSSTDIAGIEVNITINVLVSILFVKILGSRFESMTELVTKLAAVNDSLHIQPIRFKVLARRQLKTAYILIVLG